MNACSGRAGRASRAEQADEDDAQSARDAAAMHTEGYSAVEISRAAPALVHSSPTMRQRRGLREVGGSGADNGDAG